MSDAPNPTILLVDDTPENLRLLAQILSDQGYRVRTAINGERALATVHKELPDLILLDILMPDIDGYEVCRRLKSDAHLAEVPVIFISALNEVFDKVTAFEVGGVDYITKPFQMEEVIARVQTHLNLTLMRRRLHQQNLQLQEQNQELEAFAHTVAHDLKNPLATLIGFLHLLEMDQPPATEGAASNLNFSINSANRLNNIIDELLLLATVRKEQVELQPVDMGGMIAQALERIEHMRQRYQPELIIPAEWPRVWGYAPWIEEVWVNYLSNGLKYGGQPPRLELGADQLTEEVVRFWVRDNGPGIPAESQALLFTEFTRLDRVRAKGHGLGLSIVRRILTRLNGACGVQSVPGEGSLFYFDLSAV
jgi:two-component system, sensor histidine kinase and response regulator